jgi:hypothetical protein
VNTTINIVLENKKDFYSKFSDKILNQDLFDYIFNECYGENYKNNVIINIYTKKELSSTEKNNMMDMVRRTFGLKVQDELYYYNSGKDKKIILFLVGIALIIIYYLSFINVLRELILILGWLAIWESTYSFLSDTKRDYIYIYRLRKLSNCRVYFYTFEDKKIASGLYKVKKTKEKI